VAGQHRQVCVHSPGEAMLLSGARRSADVLVFGEPRQNQTMLPTRSSVSNFLHLPRDPAGAQSATSIDGTSNMQMSEATPRQPCSRGGGPAKAIFYSRREQGADTERQIDVTFVHRLWS
jgi:hypothetical protein